MKIDMKGRGGPVSFDGDGAGSMHIQFEGEKGKPTGHIQVRMPPGEGAQFVPAIGKRLSIKIELVDEEPQQQG